MIGSDARPVDILALERLRRRLASAAQVPWLHEEAARRMGDRLGIVRMTPQTVLDWGGAVGGGGEVLARAYPSAQRLTVGTAPRTPVATGKRFGWGLFARRAPAHAVRWLAEHDAVQAQAELVWSNMALHVRADPQPLMQQWHRALRVGGFLMFSTFGAGTLQELRDLYADEGWGSPGSVPIDMHDLGDLLVEVGFADPVMDQETVQLTWPDPHAALAELRGMGANVDPTRHQGLRTPRWRDHLHAALARRARERPDGRVVLSFEIVYGHAFRAESRPRVSAVTHVDLADMRQMMRAPRS
ncbi:MAG: putative biotin synthesis protein BioC [Pseudomonadota bacterium]|jgi:malonyl-CoA O-methyltransferase